MICSIIPTSPDSSLQESNSHVFKLKLFFIRKILKYLLSKSQLQYFFFTRCHLVELGCWYYWLLKNKRATKEWRDEVLYPKRVLKWLKIKMLFRANFHCTKCSAVRNEKTRLNRKMCKVTYCFGDLTNNPKLFHISQIIIAKRHLNYSQNVKWIHFSHNKKLCGLSICMLTFYTFIQ